MFCVVVLLGGLCVVGLCYCMCCVWCLYVYLVYVVKWEIGGGYLFGLCCFCNGMLFVLCVFLCVCLGCL